MGGAECRGREGEGSGEGQPVKHLNGARRRRLWWLFKQTGLACIVFASFIFPATALVWMFALMAFAFTFAFGAKTQ